MTESDLSVSRVGNGFIEIAAMVDGYRVKRLYWGYSRARAIQEFLAEHGG